MTNLQYLVPLSPQGQCFGSNHQGCSVKKGVRRNFAKFTGKHLCQGPFLMKLQYPVTLLKKRLQHRCFPVNFANFLRTPFSQNTSERLLLVFGGMPERQPGKSFIQQGIGCNLKNVKAAAKTFQCRGRLSEGACQKSCESNRNSGSQGQKETICLKEALLQVPPLKQRC